MRRRAHGRAWRLASRPAAAGAPRDVTRHTSGDLPASPLRWHLRKPQAPRAEQEAAPLSRGGDSRWWSRRPLVTRSVGSIRRLPGAARREGRGARPAARRQGARSHAENGTTRRVRRSSLFEDARHRPRAAMLLVVSFSPRARSVASRCRSPVERRARRARGSTCCGARRSAAPAARTATASRGWRSGRSRSCASRRCDRSRTCRVMIVSLDQRGGTVEAVKVAAPPLSSGRGEGAGGRASRAAVPRGGSSRWWSHCSESRPMMRATTMSSPLPQAAAKEALGGARLEAERRSLATLEVGRDGVSRIRIGVS